MNKDPTSLKQVMLLGGTLDFSLHPQDEVITIFAERGSYRTRRQSIDFSTSEGELSYRIAHDRQSSTNYFPYQKNDSQLAFRNHADFRSNNTLISLGLATSNIQHGCDLSQ